MTPDEEVQMERKSLLDAQGMPTEGVQQAAVIKEHKEEDVSDTENPLAGGTLRNLFTLLHRNGYYVKGRGWVRFIYCFFMCLFLLPLRIYHRLRFCCAIRSARVHQSPLFILGHYRSGTTHLQNLVACDPQFGFVSTVQAIVPECFLIGAAVRWLLSFFLSETRPMDNVKQAPELPEEPEHAIGNLSQACFYHGFVYPRRLLYYFRRYCLFSETTVTAQQRADDVKEWSNAYMHVLRGATVACEGKRLMIKNPADTCRISHILALFPNAKFIYLTRNPFVLLNSIRNFYRSTLKEWQFHTLPGGDEELDQMILTIYSEMIGRYEEEKNMIPKGNLIEIKFEDIETDAVQAMGRIYSKINLGGFDEARPLIQVRWMSSDAHGQILIKSTTYCT